MSSATWTNADTERARRIWAEYQQRNDVSALIDQTAGIDPTSGRIWFGETVADIWQKKQAEGIDAPCYYVRIGYEYYVRKGGRR